MNGSLQGVDNGEAKRFATPAFGLRHWPGFIIANGLWAMG